MGPPLAPLLVCDSSPQVLTNDEADRSLTPRAIPKGYALLRQPIIHDRPRRRFCLPIRRDVDRRVIRVDDDVVFHAVQPRALHRHRAVAAGGGILEVFAGLAQAVVGLAQAPEVARSLRDNAGAAGHGAARHPSGRVLIAGDDRVAHAVAPRATVELLEEL